MDLFSQREADESALANIGKLEDFQQIKAPRTRAAWHPYRAAHRCLGPASAIL
jgi:hypothetical protein